MKFSRSLFANSRLFSRTPTTALAVSILVISAASTAHAQNLFLTSGTTTINSSYDVLRVGLDSSFSRVDVSNNPYVATANLVTGASGNFVNSFNTSTVNVHAGLVTSEISSFDHSILNISGGSLHVVGAYDSSAVNITGGTVGQDVDVFHHSIVNISGGNIHNVSGNGGTANISGGIIYSTGSNSGVINISGGTFTGSSTHGTGIQNITGGTFDGVLSYDFGITNFRAGTVNNIVYGFNSGTVNISGGTIKDIFGYNDSVFNVTGGTISTNTIRLFNNSSMNIYGDNLSAISHGGAFDGFGSFTDYVLSGTLQNGQNLAGIHFYDYNDGGLSVVDPNRGIGNLRFLASVSAPEPGALAFLAFASLPVLVLIRRRSHQ